MPTNLLRSNVFAGDRIIMIPRFAFKAVDVDIVIAAAGKSRGMEKRASNGSTFFTRIFAKRYFITIILSTSTCFQTTEVLLGAAVKMLQL
mmetsp:Transcript_22013/g.33462  ORF Transcript_22013/g.33462 Transcript_22013/m.33462 type:complete len:90 (-) Transcript_22013:99-368(-)